MAEVGLARKADDDYPDLDPLNDDDFVEILGILAAELKKATERQEAVTLSQFLDKLNVDWATLSAAAVERLISGAAAVIEGSVDKIIPRTSRIFAAATRAIIPATKLHAIETHQLAISGSLSEADKETGRALLRQQSLYIRDEYGRRAEMAAVRARQIVAEGIERGLGQQEMASRMAADITLRQLGRAREYWEGIATAFSNRARTATQLNAYEEAGITRYRFVAVLDERTTDICRMLDGKVWTVASALRLQRRAQELTDAEDIKDVQPWVYKGKEGSRDILYYNKKGVRQRVAYVNESAVGQQDAKGVFSEQLSDSELEAAGIMVPPLHHKCRSTIVTEE